MDPLPITGSVLTLASTVIACLNRIKLLHGAPRGIDKLADEVADLRIVVQEVANALQQHEQSSIEMKTSTLLRSATTANLSLLLSRANARLVELDELLNGRLLVPKAQSGKSRYARTAWLKYQSTVEELRKDMIDLKINIMTFMGAATSAEVSRIRIKLEGIMWVTEGLDGRVGCHEEKAKRSVIVGAEEPANNDLETLPLPRSSISHEGTINDSHFAIERRLATPPTPTQQASAISTPQELFDLLQGKASNSNCPRWCSCRCHKPGQLRSPHLFRVILGALSIGFTDIPFITQPCNQKMCRPRHQMSTIITYQFPNWILKRAVSILISSNTAGPELLLRTLRVLPANAEIFRLAMTNNLDGIKAMFSSGRASIYDIDDNQWSLLHKSYLVGQEEIVQFLLDQGADVNLEADNKSSVVERAWFTDRTSIGSLSLNQDYIFRHVDIQEFVETQQYSTLHKIVLGLSVLDLESQLKSSTADIETPDTRARTPLWWASARGDEGAVRILLAYGASVYTKSDHFATPLHIAKTSAVAKLLLDFGAAVDDRDKAGRTPFHVCAYREDHRFATTDILSVLLNYGADIDGKSGAGHTALHYAARYGFLEHVSVLLDCRADIEARNKDGHTPLIEAVRCSKLDIVKLLLQNGADIMAVSVQGKTILHICASSSDISTIEILISARMSGLDADRKDCHGLTCREYLQQRLDTTDTTEGLATVFGELLRSIRREDGESDEWSDYFEDAVEEQEIGS